MVLKTIKLGVIQILLLAPLIAISQTKKPQALIDSLSKNWTVDSLEIKDMKKTFVAPDNIKSNFLDFNPNGTFIGQDDGTIIKGKWKLDFEKRQIINYDIDNSLLKDSIIFTIVEVTDKILAITSNPMSGNQVIMHYKLSDKK